MAICKTILIDGVETTFKASAAVPRIYRLKFGRDIYQDLQSLAPAVDNGDEEASNIDSVNLELFEDLAWVMAHHADPKNVPASPDEWLEKFNTFSIYQILPQLIELWVQNLETKVEPKTNFKKAVER